MGAEIQTIVLPARKNVQDLELAVEELISQKYSLSDVLEKILNWVEKEGSRDLLSSILLFNRATQQLFHGAAPSLPESYIQSVNGIFAAPSGGSCGTAAYRKQQVIVSDIETNPLWAIYKTLALPIGLRACWSNPLLTEGGELLGTFAVYYRQPRKPLPEDLEVIDMVSDITIYAIESRPEDFALMTRSAK